MSNYPSTFVNGGKGGQLPMPPFISQQEMDTLANDFVVHADDLFIPAWEFAGMADNDAAVTVWVTAVSSGGCTFQGAI